MSDTPPRRSFHAELIYSPNELCLLPNFRIGVHPGFELQSKTACRFWVIKLEWLYFGISCTMIQNLGTPVEIPNATHDHSD